jgi:hypothetical protein
MVSKTVNVGSQMKEAKEAGHVDLGSRSEFAYSSLVRNKKNTVTYLNDSINILHISRPWKI